MPLIKSKSNKAREKNIEEMIHAGHSTQQSIAAAYSVQREAKGQKAKPKAKSTKSKGK